MNAATLSIEPISVSMLDDGFVGAAVAGSVERGGAPAVPTYGSAWDDADHAHRRGAAVLLVVGVEDEQDVERLGQRRVRLVATARRPSTSS